MTAILEDTKKESQLVELQRRIAELQQQLQSILGSGGLRVILPDLHAENGRIDAQKVAGYIGIPLKRLSDGIGLGYGSVHRNPSAESLQDSLWPVKRTLELLHQFFGRQETVRVWLNTHQEFNPLARLDPGRVHQAPANADLSQEFRRKLSNRTISRLPGKTWGLKASQTIVNNCK